MIVPIVATLVWITCSVLALIAIPLSAFLTDPGGEKAKIAGSIVDLLFGFPLTCIFTIAITWIVWAIVRNKTWKFATAVLIVAACIPIVHAAAILNAFAAW
jgi:hypothetical protein